MRNTIFPPHQFQVVPPCGGHPDSGKMLERAIAFQVVPPCGGHHVFLGFLLIFLVVSSRAPVWGASDKCLQRLIIQSVSSRAPVWGASAEICNQFRQTNVSSRAPVWGASYPGVEYVAQYVPFQVVPPCGGHPGRCRGPTARTSFKSCPRVGGIEGCGGHGVQPVVSSRAPVWGASRADVGLEGPALVSSRAPVWGASLRRGRRRLACPVSSRAPVWGASTISSRPLMIPNVSSRAPVWGASWPTSSPPSPTRSFKSCPRVGGISPKWPQ